MRNRPVYARLAAGGFVVFVLGLLVGFASDPSAKDDWVFFAAMAVPAIAGAILTLRFGWGPIAGLVISLLLVVATFWSVFPLALGPASVLDFSLGLLLTVGKFVALIACILALVKRREARTEWGPKGHKFVRYGPVILAVMIGLSAILSVVTNNTVPANERQGALEVVMQDNAFIPNALDAKAGGETVYLLRNEGRIAHTFTVERAGVDEVVLPGSEKLVRVQLDEKTDFVCEFHDDMRGRIGVA